MITELKQMAGAIPILRDWLGEGMEPVDFDVALKRIKPCLSGENGEKCPNNVAPNWWQKHIDDPIARTIVSQLKLQKQFFRGFPPEIEQHLQMCKACGCCLRLKPFTPIKHIAEHTTIELAAKYPKFCWQRKEILEKETL